jgi:hypothetical protein
MGKQPPKPRQSEVAYLQETLGYIPDDMKPLRLQTTLKTPLRFGANPDTEVGREAIRERKHFLPWLREQPMREDDVGELARALQRHEAAECEGLEPLTGWVRLASRVNRQLITSDVGRVRLRAAIDAARAEFHALSEDEEPEASDESESEFRVAAE